ncbi:glucosaminidase domain-containing protein [Caldicellulosiruptor kronotskyensis]|uniref:glucosaminidase domain-containing protein n=1 Tax=Caldicellulosiruptor kronotskyensis TaxID=413889 RepID=UPI0009FF5B9B
MLESNYGKSVPVDKKTGQYSYDLFGIKGEGPAGSVTVTTTEYVNGKKIKIEDRFRAYNNFEESIKDHSEFLRN